MLAFCKGFVIFSVGISVTSSHRQRLVLLSTEHTCNKRFLPQKSRWCKAVPAPERLASAHGHQRSAKPSVPMCYTDVISENG